MENSDNLIFLTINNEEYWFTKQEIILSFSLIIIVISFLVYFVNRKKYTKKIKIAKSKDIQKTFENVLKLSQKLKSLILLCNWNNKRKISDTGLDFACFLYTLYFYQQVMTLKYTKIVAETIIRTLFIYLENSYKKTDNTFEKNYMLNLYIKLSNSIHKLYQIAKEDNANEFEMISMYMLSDECLMTDEEIESNFKYVLQIAAFYNYIINIDINEL